MTVRSQQDFAAQYHIQTDLGADRFFRFQTHSGQYRKEILHPDGSPSHWPAFRVSHEAAHCSPGPLWDRKKRNDFYFTLI